MRVPSPFGLFPFGGALIVAGLIGLSACAPTDAALDQHIHDYILSHPEIIPEAERVLASRQAQERLARTRTALDENRGALEHDTLDPAIGNPKGDVTIVEFFDDECPFCKMLAPTLDKVVAADPGVRVVFKEFPILGPGSEVAARYALAAHRQGRFAEIHAALMADKTPEHQLSEAHILEIAAGLGLDMAQLARDVQDPALQERIQKNRDLARRINITATPGLVIGDTAQSGALTPDALMKLIAAARARKP